MNNLIHNLPVHRCSQQISRPLRPQAPEATQAPKATQAPEAHQAPQATLLPLAPLTPPAPLVPLAPLTPTAPLAAQSPQETIHHQSPVFRRRRPRLTSPDMFADSSCAESPYQASQGGAGYNTQLAFALSVSMCSAVALVQ